MVKNIAVRNTKKETIIATDRVHTAPSSIFKKFKFKEICRSTERKKDLHTFALYTFAFVPNCLCTHLPLYSLALRRQII